MKVPNTNKSTTLPFDHYFMENFSLNVRFEHCSARAM